MNVRYSPLYQPGRAAECDDCGTEIVNPNYARFRFNGVDKAATICARHVELDVWAGLFKAGGRGVGWATATDRGTKPCGPVHLVPQIEQWHSVDATSSSGHGCGGDIL